MACRRTLGIAPLLFLYQRKSVDSRLLLGVDASWGSFSDWIDAEFPGLITLSPSALLGLQSRWSI